MVHGFVSTVGQSGYRDWRTRQKTTFTVAHNLNAYFSLSHVLQYAILITSAAFVWTNYYERNHYNVPLEKISFPSAATLLLYLPILFFLLSGQSHVSTWGRRNRFRSLKLAIDERTGQNTPGNLIMLHWNW